MRFALAVVLAAACSQPVAHRPGDTRATATIAPHQADSPDAWLVSGSLDPDHPVAWVQVNLELQPLVRLRVIVITNGSRDGFDSELYVVDGTLLTATMVDPDLTGPDDRRETNVETKGPLYVRVAATAKHPSGAFDVVAQRGAPVIKTMRVTPCDPDAFDSLNPLCRGECDFQHPDPKNRSCCAMWNKCLIHGFPRCESRSLTWDADDRIVIPLGLHQGVYGHPSGVLKLDQQEPRVADWEHQVRRNQQIVLVPTTIEADRSTWGILHVEDHDLPWLRAHGIRVEIRVPPRCQ